MKKEIVSTACLVVSVSLLLCSCGIGNIPDAGTTATPGTTLTTQNDVQVTIPTDNKDVVTTEPTTPEDNIIEDEVTAPTEDEVTEPTEDEVSEPTQAPTTNKEPTTTQKPTTTQVHKHSYTAKVTKKATCTATGLKTYTCSGCNHQYTETIAMTDHTKDKGTVTKAATCSATGIKSYKCTVCKASLGTEPIAMTDHTKDKGTVTKAATCSTTGIKSYKCTVCKASLGTEPIAMTDHNLQYVSTVKFANPAENGKENHKCKNCGIVTTITTNKIKQDAGTNYFYNAAGMAVRDGDVGISIRCAYWLNGRLYVEYTIVNNTTTNYKLTGINQLIIRNRANAAVIAEIKSNPFSSPITVNAGKTSTVYRTYFEGSEVKLAGHSLLDIASIVSFTL